MDVRIKRAYEPAEPDDGVRVLVDRVWPRGQSKQALEIEQWDKDVAPTAELRRWFGHDPERFEEFRERYRAELAGSDALATLLERCRAADRVTLVYGAKDTEHNQAVVLREALLSSQ